MRLVEPFFAAKQASAKLPCGNKSAREELAALRFDTPKSVFFIELGNVIRKGFTYNFELIRKILEGPEAGGEFEEESLEVMPPTQAKKWLG